MQIRKVTLMCVLCFACLAVFTPTLAGSAEALVLLKIDRPIPADWQLVKALDGRVVQELNTCLLVYTPTAALPRLRKAEISFSQLAQPQEGERFFLLHSALDAPLGDGQRSIQIRPLEKRIWLLGTRDKNFRQDLRQPYRLKALELSKPVYLASAAQSRPARPLNLASLADLVSQVSTTRLRSDILALQNFKTRYASTPQCEAAGAFILARFRTLGLTAKTDSFTFESDYTSKNIVAVIPGKATPQKIVLACAHYDSYSNQATSAAPGADDNASGTAAVMELARIMAKQKFKSSIVLLCVSAEEWGLYGSRHYARLARQQGQDIVAVVNLDMIAYTDEAPGILEIIANRQSSWLADRFIAVAQPLVDLRLLKIVNASLTWSDHSSFWDQGYSALCGIEDSDNPYYHKPSDTLDTLDLTFATESTKASLAVVADLAQNLVIFEGPSGLQARSQRYASYFLQVKVVSLSWSVSPGAISGYHVYRANQPGGPYLRLTEQPLTQTSYRDFYLSANQNYYFVLTSVDETGRESDYSSEVRDDQNN